MLRIRWRNSGTSDLCWASHDARPSAPCAIHCSARSRNVIAGSETPVTFVGSEGGVCRFNTVYLPSLYLLRVLLENREPGMVPSQHGVVTDTIFYWRGELGLNIGAATNPASFTFARNLWYREDAPASSRLTLPAAETGGVYGVDPQFNGPPEDLRTRTGLPRGAFGSAGPTR